MWQCWKDFGQQNYRSQERQRLIEGKNLRGLLGRSTERWGPRFPQGQAPRRRDPGQELPDQLPRSRLHLRQTQIPRPKVAIFDRGQHHRQNHRWLPSPRVRHCFHQEATKPDQEDHICSIIADQSDPKKDDWDYPERGYHLHSYSTYRQVDPRGHRSRDWEGYSRHLPITERMFSSLSNVVAILLNVYTGPHPQSQAPQGTKVRPWSSP